MHQIKSPSFWAMVWSGMLHRTISCGCCCCGIYVCLLLLSENPYMYVVKHMKRSLDKSPFLLNGHQLLHSCFFFKYKETNSYVCMQTHTHMCVGAGKLLVFCMDVWYLSSYGLVVVVDLLCCVLTMSAQCLTMNPKHDKQVFGGVDLDGGAVSAPKTIQHRHNNQDHKTKRNNKNNNTSLRQSNAVPGWEILNN